MTEPIVYVYTSNEVPQDMNTLKANIKKMTKGALTDFRTTNSHMGGKAAKFVGSTAATSYFARNSGTLAPLAWAWNRFGPLPLEFTKSGVLRVFTLSVFQRIGAMTLVAAEKFVYVTIVFEGGVVVGSIVNQSLSGEMKEAIGGTIYNTIYEQGWKDLWRHPFGYGVIFGKPGERLVNY